MRRALPLWVHPTCQYVYGTLPSRYSALFAVSVTLDGFGDLRLALIILPLVCLRFKNQQSPIGINHALLYAILFR